MKSHVMLLLLVLMASVCLVAEPLLAATVNTLPTPQSSASFNQLIGGIFQPLSDATLTNFTVDSSVTGTTCYVYYTANNSLLTSTSRSGTNCPVNVTWRAIYNYTLAVGTASTSTTHRYKDDQISLPISYTSVKYWCKAASTDDGATWSQNSCGTAYHYNIVAITTDNASASPSDGATVNTLPTPDTSASFNQLIGGVFRPLTNATLANFTVDSIVTGSTCYMYYTVNDSLITSTSRSGTNCPMNMNWSTLHNYTLAVGTASTSTTHRYKADQISLPIDYATVKYVCKAASTDNGASWTQNSCGTAYHYNIVAITTTTAPIGGSNSSGGNATVNTLPTPDTGGSFNQLIGGIFQPLADGTLANFTVDGGTDGSTCYVFYSTNSSLVTSVSRSGTNCPVNVAWDDAYNYTLAVGTPSTSSGHRYKTDQVTLPLNYTSVKYWCKASSTDNGATWDGVSCGTAWHYNIVAITTT